MIVTLCESQMDAAYFLLKWDFEPADYFETDVLIDRNDVLATIGSGVIEVRISASRCKDDPWLASATARNVLEPLFKGAQLICHAPYPESEII